MLVTLTRTLLLAGTSVPAASGTLVEVEEAYAGELLAEGLATITEPATEPAIPATRETKPTGPKETK